MYDVRYMVSILRILHTLQELVFKKFILLKVRRKNL